MFFYKPYYMEPEKGGDKAYVLLREALTDTGKMGIAKVVIKTRQYLAAVKPNERGLILELMHFADELLDASEFKIPIDKAIGRKEIDMAKALIGSMSGPWEPEKYKDDYREALLDMIEEKVEHGDDAPVEKGKPPRKTTNVIDLVAVLQESLAQSKNASKKTASKASPKRTKKKAA